MSGSALVLMVVHLLRPELRVDAVTLGLLIVGVLPWASELIESAKFPGGWEVKFKDVREAAARVAPAVEHAEPGAPEEPEYSFQSVARQDANLALVGLRIEIEKRVRELAKSAGIAEHRSLGQVIQGLRRSGSLGPEVAAGIDDLIAAGNSAAHGASVDPRVHAWAIDSGPTVLRALDALKSGGK